MKKLLFLVLMGMCVCSQLSAQHIDEVLFGNASSETAHGLTTYHPANIETFSGQGNQLARRFLPDYGNPYQGKFTGTYGGELTIVMRVDGTQQNYFTVKFSGDSGNFGRILLNVDGKEVGHRHGSDEELFMETTDYGDKLSPGAFFYRTAPIPRSLTNGKAFVTVRLRSTGWYFYYGYPFDYATYQRVLIAPTTGVYRAYMHTNPAFSLPSNDVQGATPNYTQGTATADNIQTIKATIEQKNRDLITGLLAGSNSIITTDAYYNYIEVLGVAYNQPSNTVAYHNPAVITKIRNAIDQHVVNYNNGTHPAGEVWGGAFGRSAYGMYLVYNQLTGLDDVVDLGGGAGLTRRAQWIKIFEASFNFGVTNRRIITAQEQEVGSSVYGAALGLKKLDPTTFANYPSVALHILLEGCGIEECTGSVINLATRNPTLSATSACPNGAGYYCMTTKGTSHESGWVSPDCYGNVGPKLVELYYMTANDPAVNAIYGAGKGDSRILDKVLVHTLTQTRFTYPTVLKGLRSIVSEGIICWRNVYMPGKPYYGWPAVAAITGNTTLIGYVKQMQNDGRLWEALNIDSKTTRMHYMPDALTTLANSTASVQIPSTPNQPNYVVSDEENGVVGIKNGAEYVFVTLYSRAAADNDLGKVHIITPTTERKIELKSITSQYKASGTTATRSNQVTTWSGGAPDNPMSAYGGLVENYVSYNGATAYNTSRQLKDFYQIQIGNYLIAMNCTKSTNKTLTVPTALVGLSAVNIATGATANLPSTVALAPGTTVVYYIASLTSTSGLIADATATPTGVNKAALTVYVNDKEAFNINPSTSDRVSINVTTVNYKYDLFDIFNQKLAIAKFIVQYPKATQTQVNTALSDLTTAYNNLVANKAPLTDPYKRVEAENFTSMRNVQNEPCADIGGTLDVGYIGTGSYTAYEGCYFGANGAKKFIIRYAMNVGLSPAKVSIRLDSVKGKVVGTMTLSSTGGWQTWKTDSCTTSFGITGLKNVYLVYENALNINWFQFDSTAVCTGTTNLALNKTATQSSTFSDAALAIDGNGSSYSHTDNDVNAWWQVDLGSVNFIDVVKIFNRTDCCSDRLSDFYVFVSETPFVSTDLNTTLAQTNVKSYYFAGTLGTQVDIPFNAKARFVRVQLKGQNYLHMAEVQVMGCNVNFFQYNPVCTSTNNLALNKTASQSSTGIDAARAVDGNTSGVSANNSFTHTNFEWNPWWQVDLGSLSVIDVVKLFNRTDCCGDRLSDFYLFVSETPFSSTNLTTTLAQTNVKSYYFPGTVGAQTDITCNAIGRYVRVQLKSLNYLTLAEVQVMGCVAPVCPASNNMALNKTTSQSSTLFTNAASAVDGNTSTITHTDQDPNSWWQVDLGTVSGIDYVRLFNRTDCCGDRLSNFYVFVSETPFSSTDLNTTLAQTTVKSYYFSGTAGTVADIPFNAKGRYVRVQLKTQNFLSLGEVQVMGCVAPVAALASKKEAVTIDGRQEGTKALINWVSENNKAVDYFTLEKHNPATGNFETVETIKNSQLQEVGYFTSYDNAPEEGENIYRIKRVSTNGDILFSAVKKLVFSHLETIVVSPNPTRDVLTITFDKGYTDKAIDITLMNLEGERIIVQHIDKLQSNSHTMDITNQASDGMYMLVIKAKGKRDVFKQVVITH